MSSHSHTGASARGPFTPANDRRVLELDDALRGVEAMSGAFPGLSNFRDPTRAVAAKLHTFDQPGRIFVGVVIHAIPYLNWYKVQAAEGNGSIACCALSAGSLTPVGPKSLSMPGPNDRVLVFKPRGLNIGYILNTIPTAISDGSVVVPDWIMQGSGCGLKREAGHKFPVTGLYKHGGTIDWSDQRPVDQTPIEQGWICPTGLAITIDDELVQVRVNEMCGLFATIYDSWLRLAGVQLLIESSVHEIDAGDDEGESRYFHGVATYPYEALGQYASGQQWTAEQDDKAVQYTSDKGKIDLPDGKEDLQPIYRYQEYGGYLGQGHVRLVMKPAKDSGAQQFKDQSTPDTGLFVESIGLDGAYTLLSAKSVHIGKRSTILAPKQIKPAADKGGDDGERGNYKFSSLEGGGEEHKIGDIEVTGESKSMLRVAAVLDFIAYDANWKYPHPFHYHKADYKAWNPSDFKELSKTQESINFGGDDFFVPDAEPKQLKIDHRYGQVDYFERESFLRFFDDGSVVLGSGCGVDLVMAGGRAKLSAPKGIELCPGSDIVMLAEQIVMRAKGSVDISSTDKDIRLKAEKNMQLLAGNGGKGGILLESKGTGNQQQFKNKYGEDVVSNGVIVRAAQSTASLLGKDVYIRTGGADLGEGDILLDASRGKRRVQLFGREFHTYTTKAVSFNYGPIETSSTINRTYYFGDKSAVFDVQLLLGGRLIGYNGGGGKPGIIVDGGVYGTKSFATAGVMADKKGMFLGKVPGNFAGTISSACNSAATAAGQIKTFGETRHKTTVVRKYYQPDQLGDDELIKTLQFSFRDPLSSTDQYKTSKFQLTESRWQQYTRFGLGTGGTQWTEKPVICQGRETYPWPGKQKWKDEATLLQLTELKMFDASAGRDRDRPGPYEEPQLSELQPTTPDGNYKLSR